ncbi:MAG: hypothetical protein OXN79_08780 [bacterium]|nr:hypothetical protein [bacterium]
MGLCASKRGRRVLKLWDAGNAHWECPPTHEPWQGWAQETISSWPGALVALCLHKATAHRAADPHAWAGLPEFDRGFLEAAVGADTDAAKLAQAAPRDGGEVSPL